MSIHIAKLKATLALRDAEIVDLKRYAAALHALWSIKHAEDHGLPANHLFAIDYDLLRYLGGQLDYFTRSDTIEPSTANEASSP